MSQIKAEISLHTNVKLIFHKNVGLEWYQWIVQRRISALIWDISGLWNRSDGWDYKEKWIVISRFLVLYNLVKVACSSSWLQTNFPLNSNPLKLSEHSPRIFLEKRTELFIVVTLLQSKFKHFFSEISSEIFLLKIGKLSVKVYTK